MSSQLIAQWNYKVLFITTFCHSFRKRVYYSKEIVHLQGLFVLTVSFVDIKTYPITKYYYIIERVYFIYRLFILFISTFSFLLFIFSTIEVQERLPPCQYRYFVLNYAILYSTLLTWSRNIGLFYTDCVLTIEKKVQIWTWPLPVYYL